MATPSPVFPAAVATDAQLKVANNRIQTSLVSQTGAADTMIWVSSVAGFVANCLITIDAEIIAIASVVTSPGPALVVAGGGRGFDGTQATSHSSGARVSLFIDAWHHNVVSAEVKAIEAFIGPHGQNLNASSAAGFRYAVDYQFSQSPGGTLTAGTINIVTLSPVPNGLNGTDQNHYVYISGGAGPPEAVLIVGGTAVSGASSGTIMFTPTVAHSGAWSISSASGGIAEAMVGIPPHTGGTGACIILSPGTFNIYAPVEIGGMHGLNLRGAGIGSTFINLATPDADFLRVGSNLYWFGFFNCSIVSSVIRTGGWVLRGTAPYNQNAFLKNSHIGYLDVKNQMNGFWFTQYAGVWVGNFEMNTFVNYGIGIKAGQTTYSDINQGSGLFLNNFTIYGSDYSIGGNPWTVALGTGIWIEDCDAVYVATGEIGNTRDGNVKLLSNGTGHNSANHFFHELTSDASMGMSGAGFLVTGGGVFSELFLRNSWFCSTGAWNGNSSGAGIRIDTADIGRFDINDCFIWNNMGPGIYISSAGPGGAPGYISVALSANGGKAVPGFADSIYINIPVNTPGPFIDSSRDTGPSNSIGVSLRTGPTTNLIHLGINNFAAGMSLGASAATGFLAFVQTGPIGGSPMTAGQSVSVTTPVPGAILGMSVIAIPQSNPGNGFVWNAYVVNGFVTTVLTCIAAGTPTYTIFYLRVAD